MSPVHGVLTLAGEGSRMLPWTRGLRKEFLPLFDRGTNGEPIPKPVANMALESLVEAGIRGLVLVVGRTDSAAVRNYFRIDRGFLRRHSHHPERLAETHAFYRTLSRLRIRFAIQSEPRGFGDAVLRSRPLVGRDSFVLQAGDAVLLERRRGAMLSRMISLREREDLDAVLLVRRVSNPGRYGVVEGNRSPSIGNVRRLTVRRMEEKPRRPRSRWAATALYCFSPRLFPTLETLARENRSRELEVTAGIQQMLSEGAAVSALVLDRRESAWCSVGSPEGYLRALQETYRRARGSGPR